MMLSRLCSGSVVLGCILGILAYTCPAYAEVIIVSPGESIQDAIDQAVAGDTVRVEPGTYHEAINFLGKAITVESSGGAEVTTIDGTGLDTSVVTIDSGEGPDSVLDGLTITGGTGTDTGFGPRGGGMFVYVSDPVVRNCVLSANSATRGGGAFFFGSRATFSNCRFIDNDAGLIEGLGGGGLSAIAGGLLVINCEFVGNEAGNLGGGLYLSGGNHDIVNSLFVGNTGVVGGGLFMSQTTVEMFNCTFAGNDAVAGAGMNDVSDHSWVYNSIFWGNGSEEIYTGTNTESEFHHCNVKGGWDGEGSNNLDVDPMFVDPGSGDFRLQPSSPMIDAACGDFLPPEVTTDLDGSPRFVDDPDSPDTGCGEAPMVDLGPYEYQADSNTCSEDLDENGIVDFDDLLSVLAAWGACSGCPEDLDGNGLVEFDDLLQVLAAWGACP